LSSYRIQGTWNDDEAPEDDSGYKGAKKVDLQTQLQLDRDDEALNRWKASLLGAGMAGAGAAPVDESGTVEF
jgi:hypothetical protein